MARVLRPRRWDELAKASGYNARKLASLCSISLRQLEREFKRIFNRPPQKWLDRQRIETAKQMLMDGQSIKAVAFDLGYKQSSHFCRQFKITYRMTPSEFISAALNSEECRRQITDVVAG
jgi:AraC family transcriptional regulator